MSMTNMPNRKPTSNPFFYEMAHRGHAFMLYDFLRRGTTAKPIYNRPQTRRLHPEL
jgi:hypothetical protein